MKLENLTIVTCKIVAEVGSFIRDEFKNFDKAKVEKKGLNDLVSYVDQEAEEALGSALLSGLETQLRSNVLQSQYLHIVHEVVCSDVETSVASFCFEPLLSPSEVDNLWLHVASLRGRR